MNPSVFNNAVRTSDDVYKKYIDALILEGNKISNAQKFGVSTKTDRAKFIRIKNLLPYIKTIDNKNFNNCINNYTAEVLNKFDSVIS